MKDLNELLPPEKLLMDGTESITIAEGSQNGDLGWYWKLDGFDRCGPFESQFEALHNCYWEIRAFRGSYRSHHRTWG